MNKELLEDYPHICAELKELQWTVPDSVQDSLSDYPYTPHSVMVQGLPQDKHEQIVFLRAQKLEIEEFVRKLHHSELRRIVKMRSFQGMKWEDIAGQLSKVGEIYSAESIRKNYNRIFN